MDNYHHSPSELNINNDQERSDNIKNDFVALLNMLVRHFHGNARSFVAKKRDSLIGTTHSDYDDGDGMYVEMVVVTLEPQYETFVLGLFARDRVDSGGGQLFEYWEGVFGPSEFAQHVSLFFFQVI